MIITLIKKDMQIQKKIILYTMFFGLVAIFAAIFGSGRLVESVYILTTFLLTYYFLYRESEIEGKNNSEVIFASLPIKRREIVTAKYITVLLFSLYSLLIMTILAFAFTQFNPELEILSATGFMSALISTWFFLSLALPVNLILGVKTAGIINYIIFYILLFGPLPWQVRREAPVDWDPSPWFLGICVLLLVSWLFSVWVYQRREF